MDINELRDPKRLYAWHFFNINEDIVLLWPKSQGLKINYLYPFCGISLLSSTHVSGNKNKMGFFQFSTQSLCSNKNSEVSTTGNLLEGVNLDFLHWFSGFTDGEGNFLITLDRQYIKFRFKISLHIDDVEVLNTIKSHLNIGRVTLEISRNRCSFIVENYADIKNVICYIFKSFPLHTSKRLDFENFYEAVLIKNKKNLSNVDVERIKYLKDSMNSKREIFSYNITESQIIINPNWLIGFIEGEGTFGIKTGSSMYFQVAQKNTSQECLSAIVVFLTGLPKLAPMQSPDNKILPLNVTSSMNVRTNVVSLVVLSVDGLYYYILPFLESYTMYSRKALDFKLWKIALLLKIQGYYYLPAGKKLFLDISDILNKRYSTNPNTSNTEKIIADIYERSQVIFSQDPPFEVQAYIPHVDNARKFRLANKSETPKTVYIYTNEGEVKGSPFSSFSLAHKALGLKSSSNTCNRYIDTGRLYKNKYVFTSNPIDRTSRA